MTRPQVLYYQTNEIPKLHSLRNEIVNKYFEISI